MLELDPRTYAIVALPTASEQVRAPDDSPDWTLIDWKIVPVPSPNGMALMVVGLWAHPVCETCRTKLSHAERHAWGMSRWKCPACWTKATKDDGPLRAEQLCPVCGKPADPATGHTWLPYCSRRCKQDAIGDGGGKEPLL